MQRDSGYLSNKKNKTETLFILGHSRSIKFLSGLAENAHNELTQTINDIYIKQQLI